MTVTLTSDEYNLLREFIEKECGIALGDEKAYLVESRLAKLVAENDCSSYKDFYFRAKNTTDTSLKNKIIDAMTTNETLWFRDESPYKVLSDVLLPEFATQLKAGTKKQIRIWSAACSSGQEPYSIAMTIHEYARSHQASYLLEDCFSILATDISSSVLMLAKLARYDNISMSRGMPSDLKDRYFIEQNRVWTLKDEIKKIVTFQQFNLQNSFLTLGKFDLIFLRNVAIYFSRDFKIDLFKKMASALNPGGYFIIGASESLNGYSNDFLLKEYGRSVYYQVKD